MNYRLKYPDNIKDQATCCWKNYDQILATDQVRSNTLLTNTKVAITHIRSISLIRFVPPLSQTILANISSYFLQSRNTFSLLTNKE